MRSLSQQVEAVARRPFTACQRQRPGRCCATPALDVAVCMEVR
ncbi:hypothetical protein ACPA9J_25335 [Pseudomonas aeruginosa]